MTNNHTDQIQPLSGFRQKKETDNAVIACNDYLRMGGKRSLAVLADEYNKNQPDSGILSPTLSLNTLQQWSYKFDWQQRAAVYDTEIERLKDQAAREAMNKYLALEHHRVMQLVELADFLREQLYEQSPSGDYHNIWNPDVKQVGSGENTTIVDIVRFNAPIIDQFRGVLDDIAKETGGRIKKSEFTGANGSPLIPAPSIYLPEVDSLPDDESDNMEADQ
jgi:hypothetical protein